MSIVSRLRNKHFLALASNGLISVLAFVQMGIIYRKMEMDDVGAWVFFLGMLGIAESVRTGFLNTATIKFLAGTTRERAAEVMGSVWYLALALTGIVAFADFAGVACLSFITDKEMALTIRWLGLTFISSLPYTLIFWVLMAEETYDKILWLRLVNNGSMLLAIIAALVLHRLDLRMLLWINFGSNMLTNLVGLFSGMARLGTIPKRTRACTSEIFHFGKFSLGTTFVSNLLGNVDVMVLKFMLGPAAVAVYNIPIKFMQLVEIPLRSFVGTGMSGMAIAFNQGDKRRVKEILTKYSGMMAIAFLPMALVVFLLADQAIYIIGAAKYAHTEAANLFRVFMLCAVLSPIDRFNGATLDVIHKPDVNFYKVILMLVVNVAADFIGISVLKNMYGVAIGSMLTVLSGAIFGFYILRKYIPYTIPELFVTGYRELVLLARKAMGKQTD
jgi:O-antigen/teichoic acid export membrane protein